MESEVKTEEGRFFWNLNGHGHFGIDCACGGKDGDGEIYSGSYHKSEDSGRNRMMEGFADTWRGKYNHTYYMGHMTLSGVLSSVNEDEGPLVIVCKDCQHEFSFTRDSYFELRDKARAEKGR
jgi:hypothetical protein